MKLLIAAVMLVATSAFADGIEPQQEMTPIEEFQFDLHLSDVNYIMISEDHGAIVYVFGDTDPADICLISKEYDVHIDRVINYSEKVVAECNPPAI